MRNTVTEQATLQTKIQEVTSMSRHDMHKNKMVVIVEGDDDKKIFEKFIDTEKAVIYIAKGCLWVVKVLDKLNNKADFNNKVIGIKDADFDHVLNINYNIPNLFVTDCHDIEMTLIDENFENSIYSEYNIKNHTAIVHEVSNDIKNISFVRLYNHIKVSEDENLDGINFDGLNINDIYDGISPVDLNICLNHIKNKGNSSKTWFPQEEDINSLSDSYPNIDLKQLTRGHDMMYALRVKTKALSGEEMSGYKELCRAFRMQLRKEEFMNTRLYNMINSYVTQNGIDLWKN